MSPAFLIPRAFLTACLLGLLTGGIASAADANKEHKPETKTTELTPPQAALKKNKSYQKGLKNLADGLPRQASTLFRECLDSNIPEEQKAVIRPFLAEALIRAGKTEEGLAEWANLPDTTLKKYWTATGLFNKGYFTKALETLSGIPQDDTLFIYALQLKAQLAHILDDNALLIDTLSQLSAIPQSAIARPAQVLLTATFIKLNRLPEAAESLAVLKASKDEEKTSPTLQAFTTLLEGTLTDAQGEHDKAIEIFLTLTERKDMPDKIRDLALLSLSEAEISREKNAPIDSKPATEKSPNTPVTEDAAQEETDITGVNRLLSFIGGRTKSTLLMDAFNILLKEGAFQTNPQAQEKLSAWVTSKDENRQPAAMYAQGAILLEDGDLTEAFKLAQDSITQHPQSTPTRILALNTVTVLLKNNWIKEAELLIKQYPGFSSGLAFQQGALDFRKGDYKKAVSSFNAVEAYASQVMAEAALFNKNLALLHDGQADAATELSNRITDSPQLRERMVFEQAHYAAKRGEPQAAKLLDDYLQGSTQKDLEASARLDRAEVALNQTPPDIKTATRIITVLEKSTLTDEQSLQLVRLGILKAEAQQDWPVAIQECRQAMNLDKAGKYAAELQLKLGELLYKNGDYHEAQLVLHPFSTKFPNSSLRPAALFLAGKATQHGKTSKSLENALNIFRTLGAEQSNFSLAAGIEEASVLLRMGKADDCIAVLDKMLADKQLPTYMRLLALSIQADAWVTKENTTADNLNKAVALCSEILNTPNSGLIWQYKALSQRAQFYERMNNPQKALDDYAAIMAYTPTDSASAGIRDWYWFYNAGFSSIRLMGQMDNWDGALALAKKLSETTGPRAREAATLARRIQLEHFIWQDEQNDLHEESSEQPR